MKIQMDRECLERLIGNDNEMEIEIRNGIVDTFSRKYLKALINESLINRLEFSLRRYIDEEVAKTSWGSAKLNDLIRDEIRKIASIEVAKAVDKVIEENKAEIYGKINRNLQIAFKDLKQQVDNRCQEQIPESINQLIDEKVKQRLVQIAEAVQKGE